jgi:putative SOS response-associated peptidase YedK
VQVDDPVRASYRPRYNVAPTDRHIILRPKAVEGAHRECAGGISPPVLTMARWGFPREAKRGAPHINARSETAPFRNTFRDAFVNRRCAVPADGFFEWEKPSGRPIWFHRPDGKLLLFAGLYEEGRGADGGAERRFVVLTTPANALVSPVHDRMPAILSREEAAAWLDAPVQSLLRPAPADLLIATPVSRRVGSVKNDDPDCLRPDQQTHSGTQLGLF